MRQVVAPRRNFMIASAATLAASISSATAAAATPTAENRSTFVLVHGAWHGAWCYRRVVDLLEAKGQKVFCPTMTGLGDKSHLLSPGIRLQTHIDDVVNLVKWESLDKIVLVGHSYGGMVVTGAAEALGDKVRSIVYLDAFLPASGQSLVDIGGAPTKTRFDDAAKKYNGDYLDPIPAKAFNVNAKDQAWVDSKCTLQPYMTFKDSIPTVGAYDRVPAKMYVRAVGAPSVPFDAIANRLSGTKGWQVHRLSGGHDLMVDQPTEVADLLMQAAG